MSTIRQTASNNYFDELYGGNSSSYNNSFLSGLSINTDSNGGGSFDLADYASIKNGSYGKLMKAYYGQEKAQKAAESKDSNSKLTLMAGNAGSMANAAKALMNDSLWQKKPISETGGENKNGEDYDWKAITKALKDFVDSYNKTIEGAGESGTKGVLRKASFMIKTTAAFKNTLEKAGISITGSNKLELNEEKLKEANISTLRTLFTGYNSFADKIMTKGNTLANEAASAGGTYTSSGTYSKALSQIVSTKIDTKE